MAKNGSSLQMGPIGVFDSGYGGLTVLAEFQARMPQYDYIYLGDNARAPYGNRSFERVYEFTLQAVKWFFAQGCPLVILACNTASAKALRTIQQNDLPAIDASARVLGVIRPTAEKADELSQNGHIGIVATEGTIQSKSYELEIAKLFPHLTISTEACPMWVPLVENKEYNTPGADYFVKQHIQRILLKDSQIDTLILGCTHYPLLINKIEEFLPKKIELISQGKYVAESLKDYLYRHPEMEKRCLKNSQTSYFTTDSPEKFEDMAMLFLGKNIKTKKITLDTSC